MHAGSLIVQLSGMLSGMNLVSGILLKHYLLPITMSIMALFYCLASLNVSVMWIEIADKVISKAGPLGQAHRAVTYCFSCKCCLLTGCV